MQTKSSILILAAGRSTRMGGADKLLMPRASTTMLTAIHAAAVASLADEVLVVLPANDKARRASLPETAAICLAPPSPRGIGASIATGVSSLDGTSNILITLADMPFLTTEHFNALIRATGQTPAKSIFRLTSKDGKPGHPVLFRPQYHAALCRLTGDEGAQIILKAHASDVHLIATNDEAPIIDIDTPEDWERYR